MLAGQNGRSHQGEIDEGAIGHLKNRKTTLDRRGFVRLVLAAIAIRIEWNPSKLKTA